MFLADDVDFHTFADISEHKDSVTYTEGMFVMVNEENCFLPGWLPSAESILANDWIVMD